MSVQIQITRTDLNIDITRSGSEQTTADLSPRWYFLYRVQNFNQGTFDPSDTSHAIGYWLGGLFTLFRKTGDTFVRDWDWVGVNIADTLPSGGEWTHVCYLHSANTQPSDWLNPSQIPWNYIYQDHKTTGGTTTPPPGPDRVSFDVENVIEVGEHAFRATLVDETSLVSTNIDTVIVREQTEPNPDEYETLDDNGNPIPEYGWYVKNKKLCYAGHIPAGKWDVPITATDPFGNEYTKIITVTIGANTAPTDIVLSEYRVPESQDGQEVGAIHVIDPDIADTHRIDLGEVVWSANQEDEPVIPPPEEPSEEWDGVIRPFDAVATSGSTIRITLPWNGLSEPVYDIGRRIAETGDWETVATGISASFYFDRLRNSNSLEPNVLYEYRYRPVWKDDLPDDNNWSWTEEAWLTQPPVAAITKPIAKTIFLGEQGIFTARIEWGPSSRRLPIQPGDVESISYTIEKRTYLLGGPSTTPVEGHQGVEVEIFPTVLESPVLDYGWDTDEIGYNFIHSPLPQLNSQPSTLHTPFPSRGSYELAYQIETKSAGIIEIVYGVTVM